MKATRLLPAFFVLAAAWSISFGVLAQQRPDSGRLLNEQERLQVPGLPPIQPSVPVIEESSGPAMRAPDTVRFQVNGFRISGTTAFPESVLLSLLKDYTNKELGIAEIKRAADVITRHFREHGYFVARAYVPAQEIKEGIVEIIVLEGRVDKVSVVPNGKVRLADAVVSGMIEAAIGPGEIVNEEELERALLLLNDIPGVNVRATLSPGATLGTSTITAGVSEGALITGGVDVDNSGNKFSGAERLGATLNLNDLLGRGDTVALRAVHSSGIDYGRIGYQIPVGYSGLKIGAAYANTRYTLCCEFSALKANGTASVTTLNATYPFVRERNFSLYGGIAADEKRLYDATIVGATSDRRVRTITTSVSGERRDGLGQGGQTNGAFAVINGEQTLGVPDSRIAGTEGNFTKTTLSLTRLQRLGNASALYASLAGQFASKNLDSSEKFFLGGPQGVRAYPQGEAPGDEAILLNLEYRYELSPALRLSGFVDHGTIRRYHSPWPGALAANQDNQYSLSGAGVGLQWIQPGSYLVNATVAHRLGSNPGRDPVTNNDSDATRNLTRFWLQAIAYF